jgi:hypothetical protein
MNQPECHRCLAQEDAQGKWHLNLKPHQVSLPLTSRNIVKMSCQIRLTWRRNIFTKRKFILPSILMNSLPPLSLNCLAILHPDNERTAIDLFADGFDF